MGEAKHDARFPEKSAEKKKNDSSQVCRISHDRVDFGNRRVD
jgi:hypothetical protein